jgi:hypothetical protein
MRGRTYRDGRTVQTIHAIGICSLVFVPVADCRRIEQADGARIEYRDILGRWACSTSDNCAQIKLGASRMERVTGAWKTPRLIRWQARRRVSERRSEERVIRRRLNDSLRVLRRRRRWLRARVSLRRRGTRCERGSNGRHSQLSLGKVNAYGGHWKLILFDVGGRRDRKIILSKRCV